MIFVLSKNCAASTTCYTSTFKIPNHNNYSTKIKRMLDQYGTCKIAQRNPLSLVWSVSHATCARVYTVVM